MFTKFNQAGNGPYKAGVVIQYGEKILLTHATNSSWRVRPFSIPKGMIEPWETEKDAALRELYEETGIRLDVSIKLSQPESLVMYSPQGKPTSILTYFVAKIDSLDDIGLDREVLPKFMLQLSEIDWAGFITIEEAYATIQQAQLIILDRLRG
jgi:ADP-ribose pyrophosphatase YjhB (NUDIX family)